MAFNPVVLPDFGGIMARNDARTQSQLGTLMGLRDMDQRDAYGNALRANSGALFGADPAARRSALDSLIAQGGPMAAPLATQFMGMDIQREQNETQRAFQERKLKIQEDAARRAGQPGPVNLQTITDNDGRMYTFNPRTGETRPLDVRAPVQQDELTKLFLAAGIQPGSPEAQAAAREILGRRGMPPTTNIDLGGNAFDREIGGAAAKALDTSYTQATQAQATLAAGQRIQSLLPDAITGTGAPLRLMAARIGASLGVSDGEAVRATQTLMAELSRGTLAQSEKLKGVASETDMRLLARASGGDLSLDGEAIRRIVQLSELVATDTIKAYNDLVGRSQLTGPAANVYRPIEMPRAAGAPVRVTSPEAAMRLPPGTAIELPDGSIGRVPANEQ